MRKIVFGIPLLAAIVSTVFVFVGIYYAWFGMPREGIMLFCERARDGLIKQPSNTYSNFGFVISGLAMGWLALKQNIQTENGFTTALFYPTFFATIIVIMGPGSMAMHATNAPWGGFADLLSMFFISGFMFSYALVRFFNLSKAIFALVFLGSVITSSVVYLSEFNHFGMMLSWAEMIFATLLVLGILMEFGLRFIRGVSFNMTYGYLCLASGAVAFFVWNISRTEDSWWCNPDSLLQGHALWHILCALSAFFGFLFYRSEEGLMK